MHMELAPFALCGLVLYVFAIPIIIARVLFTNRTAIVEDQLLFLGGTGNSEETNPHGWVCRQRYSPMYDWDP